MTKIITVILGVLIVLILFAWSPWITKGYAETRIISVFEESQRDVVDGCGFNCVGCGITSSNKVLFGYSVGIEYGCGLRPLNARHLNKRATKFVSFLGTVH